jgi:hypothetical protein
MARLKHYLFLLVVTFSFTVMLPVIVAWTAQPPASTQQVQAKPSVIQAFEADFYRRNGTQKPVSVRRYVIQGNYALLEWTFGEMGGMALLSKASNQWRVIEQGGGAMDVSTLTQAGVPSSQAQQLYTALRQQKLNPL